VSIRHLITDGPYTETKEHLGGFWVIDVADLDAALEWAKLAAVTCRRAVEVVPFEMRDIDELLAASCDHVRAAALGSAAVTVEAVFRREYGRCVATLIRFLGDIDTAEEAVQDAFTVAVARWPLDGEPPNPGAWIVATARNRAVDRLRRESVRDERHAQAHHLYGAAAQAAAADSALAQEETVPDDRLRLIFTCCHPALNQTAQVALTLRLLGGLGTPEIARAFLVPEATMAQRIVLAKRKISAARIPYRVPAEAELPARLKPVLAVIYLVFNEGYAATADSLMRLDLCAEAVRLARVLTGLMPDEPEAQGLLALLLLLHARSAARVTAAGSLVRLAE